MKKQSKFTKQYKIDAVRLVKEQGLSVKIVAERMAINKTVLYRWISEYETYGEESFCGQGYLLSQEAKDRKKDKKIAELELQIEILKKAAAYFAKEKEKK